MTNSSDSTPAPSSPNPYPDLYYTANALLLSGEFLAGTSLNLVCVLYFSNRTQRSSAINTLFVAISAVDLSLCASTVFPAISAWGKGSALAFESAFMCNLCGLIWHISGGLSIFLIALLAVTRWHVMRWPLKKINMLAVRVSIGVYAAIQVFKSTMNYWYVNKTYQYHQLFLGCTVSNLDTSVAEFPTSLDKLLYFLLYILEVLLPSIPIVIFSMATTISLFRQSSELPDQVIIETATCPC